MTNEDKAYFENLIKGVTSELTHQFQNRMESISENFDLKIGLIADGHITLHQAIQDFARKTEERFDLVDFKIDTVNNHLNQKIDSVEANLTNHINAVATDLKAHRADTEAHGGIYRVKEN